MTAEVAMDDVVRLCRRRAPTGIGAWPEDVLRRYLTARYNAGELAMVASGGPIGRGEPIALGIAEQPESGVIHIVAVIGRLRLLPALWRCLVERWPDWACMRITAMRRGRPVSYQPARLRRHLYRHRTRNLAP